MSPFATRTDLFARSFLEPLGRLALSMLQQFLLGGSDNHGTRFQRPGCARDCNHGRDTNRAIPGCGHTYPAGFNQAREGTEYRAGPSHSRSIPVHSCRRRCANLFFRDHQALSRPLGVDGVERVLSRIHPLRGGLPQGMRSETRRKAVRGSSRGGDPFADNDATHQESATPLVEQGGPMGPEPTDANALAQFLQIQANQPTQRRSL